MTNYFQCLPIYNADCMTNYYLRPPILHTKCITNYFLHSPIKLGIFTYPSSKSCFVSITPVSP
jgi:hypothetical protein